MPSSKREDALNALKTALEGVTGPTVARNGVIPERIPSGGLVIVRDGEVGEPEVVLSPVAYTYEHRAMAEVFVQDGTATERDAALDGILQDIGSAILADPTLDGTVDYARVEAPEILDEEPIVGDADAKRAIVPIVLEYTTSNPLL